MNTARLELIMGPMFSGKSTEIIRRIRRLRTIGKRVLVIKPSIDNRYADDKIATHDWDTIECVSVERLSDVPDSELAGHDAVVIDEAQFFPDLRERVSEWLDRFFLTLIVAGLDGDFQRNPIGQILDLVPLSDHCQRLVALCSVCNDGTEAPFTMRRSGSHDKILVGGSDVYFPVCRRHYRTHLI